MKMTILVLGIFVLAATCYFMLGVPSSSSTSSSSVEVPSDRDLELAALNNLSLPFFSEFFPKSDAQLDDGQKWIDQKREWVKTIEDRRVRKAYAKWIDYVEIRLNDNRKENKTHAERDGFNARMRAREEEWARGRAVAPTIPRPQ